MDLKPIHHIVAHDMALGLKLTEICRARNLTYASFQQVKKTPEFQNVMNEYMAELQDRQANLHIEDPVLAIFNASKTNAATRIVEEMESFGEDSTSTSRQKAANSVLDRIGYSSNNTQEAQKVVNIHLSETKQTFLQISSSDKEEIPDNITIR